MLGMWLARHCFRSQRSLQKSIDNSQNQRIQSFPSDIWPPQVSLFFFFFPVPSRIMLELLACYKGSRFVLPNFVDTDVFSIHVQQCS